ncbi:hypothetical protein L596_001881 [Steinernema carpocapsae]|uniref:Uncharacterized protein n=1 Tax=Steinernema carpocapsae TaxID=34508 RepID=A0A4V6I7I4_STECR|nr:hypothetical protein L596_001881 [Steinernema carpocapsae]
MIIDHLLDLGSNKVCIFYATATFDINSANDSSTNGEAPTSIRSSPYFCGFSFRPLNCLSQLFRISVGRFKTFISAIGQSCPPKGVRNSSLISGVIGIMGNLEISSPTESSRILLDRV